MRFLLLSVATLLSHSMSDAFVTRSSFVLRVPGHVSPSDHTRLSMIDIDIVTSLRTEYISAALCTNQTPRAADVCLQLGCQDGRAITFLPRTIRELITSTVEADGVVPISIRRQLKQQQEQRKAAKVTYMDQRADDLKETWDETVDVVVSLQAAQKMALNGLDWKKSIREAARVLKPGGRLLFVENTEINGESYLDYVQNLVSLAGEAPTDDAQERFPIFEVGFDEVDMVLKPHIAGVAIKSVEAGLTAEERARRKAEQEKERLADLSIEAYERGIKRRKKKKKTSTDSVTEQKA